MYSVSVIMPVYNNEDTLNYAVESVLNQTQYDLELLLINDGSTDNSGAICDAYAKMEPLLVEVIHQQRSGFGVARNRGLSKAKGHYIYFANAKNTFSTRMLEDNIKLAEEKNSELIVFGFEEYSNQGNRSEKLPNLPLLTTQEQFRDHYRNFYHFYPFELCNKLYRKDYLRNKQIKFYNVFTREEVFFNLGVYKDLNSVAFNRAAYCHRLTEEKMISEESLFEINIEVARYFEKIIKYWGYTEEFEDLILDEYFDTIYREVLRLTNDSLGLSSAQQINQIEKILTDKRIAPYLNDLKKIKTRDPYKRAILKPLQKGDKQRVIQVASRMNETQTSATELFSVFRKKLKNNLQ